MLIQYLRKQMKTLINHCAIFILLLISSTGCDVVTKDIQQSDLQLLADNLELNYELLKINKDGDCLTDKTLDECYVFQLSLTMPMAFYKRDWGIYFSQKNPIIAIESEDFTVKQISGELNQLKANEHFKGFEKNKTIYITLTSKAVQLKDALLLPNFYVMSEGLTASVIKSTLQKI